MKNRIGYVTIALVTTIALAAPALRGLGAAPGAQARPANGEVVARVGTLQITRAEFERESQRAVDAFEQQRGPAGDDVLRLIRRQTLERLIRADLLKLEARRRNVPVSEALVDAEFRQNPFFNRNGTFDEALYQKVKAANSPEYRAAVEQARASLGARELSKKLEAQYSPDPARARADVERRLSKATLDYLALRLADFDGGYREPAEAEVLAYYRAHLADFNRLDRAELSVIQVGDQSYRGRATADSLVRAIQEGSTFQGAGENWGGIRSRVLVTSNDFPAYWVGDAASRAQVFRAKPGDLLPQPVPGHDGWLVVRVDDVHPAGVAPLRDVSREIRTILREQARAHADEKDLRAQYDARRSMLKSTAVKVRYAVVDTNAVVPGKPSASELADYYRGHLANYSAYDAATASIRAKSYAEVEDDVRAQWTAERRVQLAGTTADAIRAAWTAGRRDRSAESRAKLFEAPPVPADGRLAGTDDAAKTVSDSIAARGGALGVGVAALGSGRTVVFHVYQRIPDYVPSFDEYRARLEDELLQKRQQSDERDAHALFDRDHSRWAGGRTIYFTEAEISYLDPINVPLTRQEVERYHRANLDKYSAPEQVRARHILFAPKDASAGADAEAKRRAADVLRRLQAGESFEEMARRYTDDTPTQASGGDLGYFGRGVMLEPLERAAFAMKVGETSGLIRTEAGYHILRVVGYIPRSAEPLSHIYSNVGYDAAIDKTERVAAARGDSLVRVARTRDQLMKAAKKLGLTLIPRTMSETEFARVPEDMRLYLEELATLAPGQVLRRTRALKGEGVLVAWLDSVGVQRDVVWEEVRDRVLLAYRNDRSIGVLRAKRAELDSMQRAGWSVDSLAALWGGLERVSDVQPGKGILGLGGAARVDSLVFGAEHSAALETGATSDWVELPTALARIRLISLQKPGADRVAARVEARRRWAVERGLEDYFAKLRQDFTVTIVDGEMRETALPPLPSVGP